MAEYIERETLYELLKDEDRCGYLDRLDIAVIPSADVTPVRHGKWEDYPSDRYKRCTACKLEFEKAKLPKTLNYCPNCGAKMVGKAGEQE